MPVVDLLRARDSVVHIEADKPDLVHSHKLGTRQGTREADGTQSNRTSARLWRFGSGVPEMSGRESSTSSPLKYTAFQEV
ncbi:hypothetical protein EYF80_054094 [Liparis tanakae]|uniref:Uncharacterized protein n=1 Tax=Liparis tanakae TaxID=230148 RepID=A0A4Z2F5H0_9TELE|nr:hypothetical protein EYF80_054094 [Liparis tanakae]